MLEKNGAMLVLSIMIILFTEIIGINMDIALNYLPIFFAIIIVILFNLMLIKRTLIKKV